MKKVILISSESKADLLDSLGFSSCGTRYVDDKLYYQYVLTDRLHKVLKDKSKFSKRDYQVEDTRLTF